MMAKEYSRVAVWRAMNSEYGDRLQEIMQEHLSLVKQAQERGKSGNKDILSRIEELRAERDSILSNFEDKPDQEHQEEEEKKVGRPALGVTKKVSITLPEDTWETVDALVDFFDTSKSSVFREAIELYAERLRGREEQADR